MLLSVLLLAVNVRGVAFDLVGQFRLMNVLDKLKHVDLIYSLWSCEFIWIDDPMALLLLVSLEDVKIASVYPNLGIERVTHILAESFHNATDAADVDSIDSFQLFPKLAHVYPQHFAASSQLTESQISGVYIRYRIHNVVRFINYHDIAFQLNPQRITRAFLEQQWIRQRHNFRPRKCCS